MRTTLLAFVIVISGMSGNLQAAHRPHGPVHKVKKSESAARKPRKQRIALPPARKPAAGALRAKSSKPAVPVAPLPETPALGPGTLVHMERILPFQGLTPAPAEVAGATRGSAEPASASTPSLAGLRKVLPPEDDSDDTLALPSGSGSTEFEAADRTSLDLLWPVQTRTISSAWGPRMRTRVVSVRVKVRKKAPRRNRRIIRRFLGSHKGVDLSAPRGTDIFAAMDGLVVASGRQKTYGNFVAVDHGNGVVTLYAHCNRNFVESGDIVRRGQKIAEVGSTGNSTGPHLHFELRLDGIAQNPLPRMNDTEEIPSELLAQNLAATPPAGQR
jgi:murein DD-endopeptidase MepM/ murein hydrolase activator NlpD